MRWLWNLLFPMRPFGLFLEGMTWSYLHVSPAGRVYRYRELTPVSDPTQVGPNRSDPSHYDEMGRYLWWGC